MSEPNIIYELNLETSPGIGDEFEPWLRRHTSAMLELSGFRLATLYSVESADDAEHRHYCVHFLLESHAALEQSVSEHAAETRRAGLEKFGDQLTIHHRVLTESDALSPHAPDMYCRNCSSPIRGQYCAGCGQRSISRVITMWELTRDMVGDIADLDSRIWRSLIPLLLKPGHLTADYLKGRRARYMPPFRMYLVLSILFFLLMSLFHDTDNFIDDSVVMTDSEMPLDQEQLDKVRKSLDEAIPENADNPEVAKRLAEVRSNLPQTVPDEIADLPIEDEVLSERAKEKCKDVNIDMGDSFMPWISEEQAEAKLRKICEKVVADSGRSLLKGLQENFPQMLFIFLPVIALVLKGLYPLSRRYYVEHLLFVIHFHAFVFLALILELLVVELAATIQFPTWPFTTLLSLYIPYYLYRSMRRVYGQSRVATLYKYVLLFFFYFFSLLLTALATLAFTAFTL